MNIFSYGLFPKNNFSCFRIHSAQLLGIVLKYFCPFVTIFEDKFHFRTKQKNH